MSVHSGPLAFSRICSRKNPVILGDYFFLDHRQGGLPFSSVIEFRQSGDFLVTSTLNSSSQAGGSSNAPIAALTVFQVALFMASLAFPEWCLSAELPFASIFGTGGLEHAVATLLLFTSIMVPSLPENCFATFRSVVHEVTQRLHPHL